MSSPRPSHSTSPSASGRLVPRWWTVTVLSVLTLATAGFAVGGAVAGGAMGWSLSLLAAACGLTLVAAGRSLLTPKRRRELSQGPGGTVVLESPGLIAWSLVAAWMALLGVAGLWVWVALTDFGSIESPGFTLLTVAGAAGSLPDLVRLLTGRLHRWRLTLGPEALTYRGYHTDETVPWNRIHGTRIQRRGPAGVLVDRKGTGPDLVIPVTAFPVPPEQIVDEIQQRLAARRR